MLCLRHAIVQRTFHLAPPPDCSYWNNPGTWYSGSMDVRLDVEGRECIVKVYFCGRNLSGTGIPCERGGDYNISCEYKLTKACFPQDCEIRLNCENIEMNTILQSLINSIAVANPLNHVAPTSGEWNDPVSPLRAAWKLSFPACIRCLVDPVTGCTTIEKCNEASCWKWFKAYRCDASCPTVDPPCPDGTCNNTQIRLSYIPYSSDKDVGECPQGTPPCILCGY